MGKPNPSVQKRLREQKKREKRIEKARRKAEREAAKQDGTFNQLPPDGAEADPAPAADDEEAPERAD